MPKTLKEVSELTLYLTDIMCDISKPWSEVHIYFPEWLFLIRLWRELTTYP